MSLRESPFHYTFLEALFSLSSLLLFPSYWFVDRLLSCVVHTSVEHSQGPAVRILMFLAAPVLLLLFLLSLPLAILGLLLWSPLQKARRPFCYQQHTRLPFSRMVKQDDYSFVFISANLCLLPEGLARFSNLRHTQSRTAKIGHLLQSSSLSHHDQENGQVISTSFCSSEDVLPIVDMTDVKKFPGKISPEFPIDADFICLQEVFDGRASRKLRCSLAPSFPHILYDIGHRGPLGCGFKFFSSGLFLASRYPPLNAQYYYYPNARGEDALAAKGLFCVKVQIGVTEENQKIVGYINSTHLHAPEDDGPVRCDQMSLLLQWVTDFQAKNCEESDIVAFDVLCGDLNFDNCSPDDCLEQKHNLFSIYKDPCRDSAGHDVLGTVGTLLRQELLYDEAVRTPENLKRTLQSDTERRLYIAPPLPVDTDCQNWTGRRIDYILYQEINPQIPAVVDEFLFITQLAGLSDHIPVSMRLKISLPQSTYL
ncbi:sphingomyelin phosphodiesterase 5 [Bombina bombina]|uniref:sphingomyelin phosphodiesterase 5 n=1 Tax=Bombina bombina TaxID=8345 RepID=UPI00235B17BD|nr:sphingomyelin phosphodiesterase 5 [Bombina bombina]